MKLLCLIPFLLFIVNSGKAQTIEGIIFDKQTRQPLDYVQIGIPKKKIGTLSDVNGQFRLANAKIEPTDTIIFSYLGYEQKVIVLSELLVDDKLEVLLNKELIELPTSTINAKSFGKIKKIGYPKTKGKSKVTGWKNMPPDKNFYEIGERGSVIQLSEEVLVKSINFHIAKTDFDSLLFRVHLYDFEDGIIGKELTKNNIFVFTNIKKGWVKISMDDAPITLENDFIITLEWVEGWTNLTENIVLLSCKSNGGTNVSRDYYSDNSWNFSDNWHTGIFLEVKPAK